MSRSSPLVHSTESELSETNPSQSRRSPSREEAIHALRTLIHWAGDDPSREGLRDTPLRVLRAFDEYFAGYHQDPLHILQRTFEDVGGYSNPVVLRDIRFVSHCEHHLAPIIGQAHIAYIPNGQVVGISKLARVVDTYARRLQVQERMTSEIAMAIETALAPRGVAVIIEASHQCMTTRGAHKPGVIMTTSSLSGEFRENSSLRQEILGFLQSQTKHSSGRGL